MCEGTDSTRKPLRQGATAVRVRRPSPDQVEDELASMRGTKDVDKISYPERRQIHSVCSSEEKLWVERGDAGEVSSSRASSRDSSPAKSLHLSKRQTVSTASDTGRHRHCHLAVSLCCHAMQHSMVKLL